MTEKNIVDQALKQGRSSILVGIATLFFGFIFTIQLTYYPSVFTSEGDNITTLDTVNLSLGTMDLDPAEIQDGIHLPTGMIVDDGVDVVINTCGACHSLDLVTQNRADRAGWKDIIVWMQETQKLWDLGASENVILTYLSKNYAPEDTGRRRNLEGIEWYQFN